jgi:hypothetical protein
VTWIPGDDLQCEPGQPVHACRYITPWLHVANTADREPAGEWTGVAHGENGMIIDPGQEHGGEYLDFGWVFLGGDPNDGTARYLITEVEAIDG